MKHVSKRKKKQFGLKDDSIPALYFSKYLLIFSLEGEKKKNTRPDEALVWTQNVPPHSGSRAQMNISLVNTSSVMLAFYCQDLGKAVLAHTSEVKPCRHLPST